MLRLRFLGLRARTKVIIHAAHRVLKVARFVLEARLLIMREVISPAGVGKADQLLYVMLILIFLVDLRVIRLEPDHL